MSNKESFIMVGEYEGATIAKSSGIKTIKFKLPYSEFPAYIRSGLIIDKQCKMIVKQGDTIIKLSGMTFGGLNVKRAGDAQLKMESENAKLDQFDDISSDEIVKIKVIIDLDDGLEDIEDE